jgi:hypothetical protein
MALSSTAIVKVIIVTDDLERTAGAYERLLGTDRKPEEAGEHRMVREPYTRYMGKQITDTPMKVKSVLTENFWFEIIQPLGDNDPWAQWLKDHGTSVCSICLVTNGALEEDERRMAMEGYRSVFKQEKGYEAYEYFDTARDLGTLLEMKEIYREDA